MDKYQGEKIAFNIKITSNPLSDFTVIKVYMYTSDCNVVKFSNIAEPGYEVLSVVDNNTLNGEISSSHSKNMSGTLLCDLFFDGKIGKVSTGITIVKNIIKNEL